MRDIVFDIEEKFPEGFDIEVNGVKFWPYLRIMLRYMMIDKKRAENSTQAPVNNNGVSTPGKLSLFKNLFIDNFGIWWRRADILIFSNSLEKKQLGQTYVDKLSEPIAQQTGNRALTINYIAPFSLLNKKLKNKKALNGTVIDVLTARLQRFKKITISDPHGALLKNICARYGLAENDLQSRIRYFLAKALVLKILYKIKAPKCVITSCYSYYSEVFAARKLNIKTIELQHGIISPLHPGYESAQKINKDFTAEYLFLFGRNSLKGLSNNIVQHENTFFLGNAFLEQLYFSPLNQEILNITRKYEKSVCVPTDYLTEETILSFLVPAANQLSAVCFLVSPRIKLSGASEQLINGCGNIIVVNNFSFQDIVRHCDYHTATDSTCCLEALSLGVRNILINTDGKVYKMYNELVSPEYTRFVANQEDYISEVSRQEKVSKDQVRQSNSVNFEVNYQANLDKALKKLGIDTING